MEQVSKLHRLRAELRKLEVEGLIKIERDTMTIIDPKRERYFGQTVEVEVRSRLLHTGPWGALLLMGRLDEALKDITGEGV